MTTHRHAYEPSPLDPSFQVCRNARFGCDTPRRRVPTSPVPAQEHSETSKAAARSLTSSRRHANRVAVFTVLKKARVRGCTDQEIAAKTGMDGNSARPRRIDLVEEQLVVHGHWGPGGCASGVDPTCPQIRTRATKAGRAATVWILAEFAHTPEALPLGLVPGDGAATG